MQDEAKKLHEQQKRKHRDLAACYARTFGTEEGKKVMQDLFDRFVINNDTNLASANINYEAAYHNGEAGAIKFISQMVARGHRND